MQARAIQNKQKASSLHMCNHVNISTQIANHTQMHGAYEYIHVSGVHTKYSSTENTVVEYLLWATMHFMMLGVPQPRTKSVQA